MSEEAKLRGLSDAEFIDMLIGKHCRFTQSPLRKEEDRIELLNRMKSAMKGGRKIEVNKFITNFALNVPERLARILLVCQLVLFFCLTIMLFFQALHSNENQPVVCLLLFLCQLIILLSFKFSFVLPVWIQTRRNWFWRILTKK